MNKGRFEEYYDSQERSFTKTEVTGCDRSERCSILYSNYDEVVDGRSHFGPALTRKYSRLTSEEERFKRLSHL